MTFGVSSGWSSPLKQVLTCFRCEVYWVKIMLPQTCDIIMICKSTWKLSYRFDVTKVHKSVTSQKSVTLQSISVILTK